MAFKLEGCQTTLMLQFFCHHKNSNHSNLPGPNWKQIGHSFTLETFIDLEIILFKFFFGFHFFYIKNLRHSSPIIVRVHYLQQLWKLLLRLATAFLLNKEKIIIFHEKEFLNYFTFQEKELIDCFVYFKFCGNIPEARFISASSGKDFRFQIIIEKVSQAFRVLRPLLESSFLVGNRSKINGTA